MSIARAREVASPTTGSARTRTLTVIAQDPGVRSRGRIVTTRLRVPAEVLAPGPWGYRVHVIDYDSSKDALHPRAAIDEATDAFEGAPDGTLLGDPRFHAQNVYAIAMATLARFEFALGRRVGWAFSSHQLKIAPHAFADANAFYSREAEALLFGYFAGEKGEVHTALSHDVVAHETTHALLDGLRERYTDPSSPDQAAFHEGFADVVALLSVFAQPSVVGAVLDPDAEAPDEVVRVSALTAERLKRTVLFGLAEQMGEELQLARGSALRSSLDIVPSPDLLASAEFQEPHRRGEILVAAMLSAFLEVWVRRLQRLGEVRSGQVDRALAVEQGADAAERLLTMAIRAIDYAPPVDLQFGDYLSALLTADVELRPDDSRYGYREALRRSFAAFGIEPASPTRGAEPGVWQKSPADLRYDRSHFESMQRDPGEVFRFMWENRTALGIEPDAYSKVISVRPVLRIDPDDGFALHETVAEYVQILDTRGSELADFGIARPEGMPDEQRVLLYGGGILLFDEYGRLKYHVYNHLLRKRRQSERLAYLWRSGAFRAGASIARRIAALHRRRALDMAGDVSEEW
ncbi:MAG TPA: hypothetical protein VFM93_00640 [Candidatus Limnocylindria bacterium]|nr:hypothetical protein [Candidatus Limnocylindria bacterium]